MSTGISSRAISIIHARVGVSSCAMVELGASRLEIPSHPELPNKRTPELFISYAWGDDSSEDAWKHTGVVDRLCETLRKDSWNIIRDKNAMRSGDLISDFVKLISQADHVIVVLSDKYLRSPYCMTELHAIYQRLVGEKGNFGVWGATERNAELGIMFRCSQNPYVPYNSLV